MSYATGSAPVGALRQICGLRALCGRAFVERAARRTLCCGIVRVISVECSVVGFSVVPISRRLQSRRALWSSRRAVFVFLALVVYCLFRVLLVRYVFLHIVCICMGFACGRRANTSIVELLMFRCAAPVYVPGAPASPALSC
jgi:hypothetical protein